MIYAVDPERPPLAIPFRHQEGNGRYVQHELNVAVEQGSSEISSPRNHTFVDHLNAAG